MKSRFLNNIIKKKSTSKFGRIIVITGARQTGKTTLARKCFPGFTYISIEDPITRGEYSRLTSGQWNMLYPNAILDEVQKQPDLIDSIKSVYDQYDKPKYILLGSSQILLLRKVKESLAGRCSIYDVYPLTLPEMLTERWEDSINKSFFQKFLETGHFNESELLPSINLHPDYPKIKHVFDHYMQYGGYPAIFDNSLTDEEKRDWLNNYIRTYLERDVRDLADFKNLEPFIRVQQTSSLLTGNLVNYSQLAREAGISSNTANRFLSYLEISYQAILLKPWYRNRLKRLNKSPKLHYLDPGIQKIIIKKQGMISGNEYESAIVSEMFKQIHYLQFKANLYHLRTVEGREIDFLIELEDAYIAIEIKMTNNIRTQDARHLKNLEEILDKPVLQSFVLSNDIHIKKLADKIWAIPAAMFLT